MERNAAGKTLLELLATLAIIAVLSSALTPQFATSLEAVEASQFSHLLTRALTLARATAVSSGERVTLCFSNDGVHCSKTFVGQSNILVFRDHNSDRKLDANDTLYRSQKLALYHGKGFWRGSLGRPYMRYRVDGSAVEYGRYSYCPTSENRLAFRQIVINHVGRPYTHFDGGGRLTDCGW